MQQREGGWVRRTIGGIEADARAGEPRERRSPSVSRTFIDQGAAFEGTLRLTESLHIDSEFRGAIESEGTVIVGESAGIEASIRAREVVICGAVVGDVVATRQLTIRPGGKLHGDVETPCLVIEKHAFFNGRTTMMRPEAAARASTTTDAVRAARGADATDTRPVPAADAQPAATRAQRTLPAAEPGPTAGPPID